MHQLGLVSTYFETTKAYNYIGLVSILTKFCATKVHLRVRQIHLILGRTCTPAASRAAPWWVTQYAPRVAFWLEKRWDKQTDGQTDGLQTVTLRLPLDAASVIKEEIKNYFRLSCCTVAPLYACIRFCPTDRLAVVSLSAVITTKNVYELRKTLNLTLLFTMQNVQIEVV